MKPGAKPAAAVQRATDWLQCHLKRPQVTKIDGLIVVMMMVLVMVMMVQQSTCHKLVSAPPQKTSGDQNWFVQFHLDNHFLLRTIGL